MNVNITKIQNIYRVSTKNHWQTKILDNIQHYETLKKTILSLILTTEACYKNMTDIAIALWLQKQSIMLGCFMLQPLYLLSIMVSAYLFDLYAKQEPKDYRCDYTVIII